MDDEPENQVLSIEVQEPELHVCGHLFVGDRRGTLVMDGSLCTQSSPTVAEDLRRRKPACST